MMDEILTSGDALAEIYARELAAEAVQVMAVAQRMRDEEGNT